jgi:hypothetical protein
MHHMSDLSRRSLVASAAALPTLAVPAVAVAVAAEPDPVYALIEAHKQACQNWSDAVDIQDELTYDDPNLPSAEEETERRWAVIEGHLGNLCSAMPSTIAGVAALAEYYHATRQVGWEVVTKNDLFEVLANIAQTLKRHGGAGISAEVIQLTSNQARRAGAS